MSPRPIEIERPRPRCRGPSLTPVPGSGAWPRRGRGWEMEAGPGAVSRRPPQRLLARRASGATSAERTGKAPAPQRRRVPRDRLSASSGHVSAAPPRGRAHGLPSPTAPRRPRPSAPRRGCGVGVLIPHLSPRCARGQGTDIGDPVQPRAGKVC